MIGITHFRTQQDELAAVQLRQAAAYTETTAVAHYFLGRIAMRHDEPEQASREYEHALAANSKYADAYAELGSVYLAARRFDEARQAVARALELDPEHYQANFYLLKLYRKLGDPRSGQQEAKFNQLHEKQFEDLRLLLRTIQARPY